MENVTTPPASEQKRVIERLLHAPPSAECYLVSVRWWTKWKQHIESIPAEPFADQIDNLELV